MSGLEISERIYDCVEVSARRGQGRALAALLVGALPMAPDKWLVTAQRARPGELAERLLAQLDARAWVVDLSSAYAVRRLSGADARAVLARLCRLDLHPREFAVGAVARTLMAQVPVLLHLVDDSPQFDLFIPASLAVSLSGQLHHAAGQV